MRTLAERTLGERTLAPTIWDDAVFLWKPDSGAAQSLDLVTGSRSNGNLTEGTSVSSGGHDGRAYPSGQQSLFGTPISQMESPQEVTMMAVVRLTGAGQLLYGLTLTQATPSNQWVWMRISNAGGANTEFSYRLANQGAGNNFISAKPPDLADTNLHTIAIRISDVAGLKTVDSFVDSATPAATNTGTPTLDGGMVYCTIGRATGQNNSSNGGEVFAAAVWPRALDPLEMTALMADPFGYLSLYP